MSPGPGDVTSTPAPLPAFEDVRSLLPLNGVRSTAPERLDDDDDDDDDDEKDPLTLGFTTRPQHPALSNEPSVVRNGASHGFTTEMSPPRLGSSVAPIDHHVPPPPRPPHLEQGNDGVHAHDGGGDGGDDVHFRRTRTIDAARTIAPIAATVSAAPLRTRIDSAEAYHRDPLLTGSRRGRSLPTPPPTTTESPIHQSRAGTVPVLRRAAPGALPPLPPGPPLGNPGSSSTFDARRSSIDHRAPTASTSFLNADRREPRRASLLDPTFSSTSSASISSPDECAGHPLVHGLVPTPLGGTTIGKRPFNTEPNRPPSAISAFGTISPGHMNNKKGKSRMCSDDPLQYSGWGTQLQSATDPLDPLSQMFTTARSREPFSNASFATSRTAATATTAATTRTTASLDPSVQALLDAVDLGAARKLVQDLEAQLPVGTSTMGRSLPPALTSSTASTNIKFATTPTSPPPIATAPVVTHPPPKVTTRCLSLSAPRRPSLQALESTGKDSLRRRSFSVGKGFGRQPSTGLPTSTSGIIAPNLAPSTTPHEANLTGTAGTNVEQRIIDERIAMGASGRMFEDQISKVQLQLSPATHRRAQNCIKYLSLRYRPLGAQPLPADDPPFPNLLAVSRWRLAKQQIESTPNVGGSADGRRYRGSSGAFVDTSKKVPPYGKRRNEKPGVWEVYPDDILDYLKAGGRLVEPANAEYEGRSSRMSVSMPPSPDLQSSDRQSMSLPFPSSSERTRSFTPDQFGSLGSTNRPSLSRVREHSYDSARHVKVRSIDSFLGFGTPSDPTVASSSVSPVSPPRVHQGRFNGPIKDEISSGGGEDSTVMETHAAGATERIRNSTSHSPPHRSRLTSSISRRFEKMRGRGHVGSSSISAFDWESSDGGLGPLQPPHRKGYYSVNPSLPGTPEGSDHELAPSPSAGAPMVSKRSLLPSANLNLSNSTWKKGTASLRRNRDRDGERTRKEPSSPLFHSQSRLKGNGIDSGQRSSGGEELKAGFCSPLTKDGSLSRSKFVTDGRLLYSPMSGVNLLDDEGARRRIFDSHSEDDVEAHKNATKEVIDVSEERFAQLMQSTKAAYSDVHQIESFMSTVPLTIKINFDGLVGLSSQTLKKTGIQITAQVPRLPASVIQSIVRLDPFEIERGQNATSVKGDGRASTGPLHGSKEGRRSHVRFASSGSTESSDSDSDSDSGTTSSSSDDAGNRSDDERELDTISTPPRRRKSSLPPIPSAPTLHPRAATDIVIAPFDPLPRSVRGRIRSATLAVPSPRLHTHPAFDPLVDLQTPIDPIKSLELALQKFEKTLKVMDDAAEKALEEQRSLNVEIEELVLESRQVMKDYDSADLQFIQPLQEQVHRVLQLLDKTSSSYDGLWIALSIVAGFLLWLARLVAILINCVRSVVKYPFRKVHRVVSPAT